MWNQFYKHGTEMLITKKSEWYVILVKNASNYVFANNESHHNIIQNLLSVLE